MADQLGPLFEAALSARRPVAATTSRRPRILLQVVAYAACAAFGAVVAVLGADAGWPFSSAYLLGLLGTWVVATAVR